MESTRPVKQLSRGEGASVHRYYDVPVESPDSTRVLYFEFDGGIPGSGSVIVAGADGSGPKVVGRCEQGAIGHVGALQMWLDDRTICFRPHGHASDITRILSLVDGSYQDVAGDFRSFSEITAKAAMFRNPYEGEDEFLRYQRPLLGIYDPADDSFRDLITLQQAADAHPADIDLSRMNMMNAKFSPGGKSLFVVFTDEIYCRRPGEQRSIKSLIHADIDSGEIRYLGEFSHHPMWAPDGLSVIAHVVHDNGQDLMRYSPTGAGEPEVMIRNFVGVHTSLNRAQTYVVTDAFETPTEHEASILLYALSTGKPETLAHGRHERHDHKGGCHSHPQWSRDESRIFFNLSDTGTPQLYATEMH
ncbi:MAG: hypothetical protein ACLFVU_13225 [Phycisphaerae bacterium]